MKDLVGPGQRQHHELRPDHHPQGDRPEPGPDRHDVQLHDDRRPDPATFDLEDGESQDYGSEVLAGSYSVTEDDPSPDFVLTDIDCSASDRPRDDRHDRRGDPDGSASTSRPRTRSTARSPTRCSGCAADPQDSTKGGAVSNAGAVFSYDGSSVTDNGAGDEDPDVGEVCVSGLLPGDYTVNETSPPPGYGGAPRTDVTVTVVVGTNCTDNQPTGPLRRRSPTHRSRTSR